MKLYHHPLSGHAHRARLFLSLIGADFELVEVDLAAQEQKSPAFLKLNPLGQVPVLDDDGTIVPDSIAILIYAAKNFGRTDWLPEDPAGAAQVQRWLSVAAGPIVYGPAYARAVNLFKRPYRKDDAIERAQAILRAVDDALQGRTWIVDAPAPTIADIALYSYIARAPEGDIDLAPYGAVNGWLGRVEALDGFVPLQKSAVGLEAA